VGLTQPVLRVAGERARRISRDEILEATDGLLVIATLERVECRLVTGLLAAGRSGRHGAAGIVHAACRRRRADAAERLERSDPLLEIAIQCATLRLAALTVVLQQLDFTAHGADLR